MAGNGNPKSLANLRPNQGKRGRKPGSRNLVPETLRLGILKSYDKRGGIRWLNSLENDLFVGLIGKILPRTIEADIIVTAKFEADEAQLRLAIEAMRARDPKAITSTKCPQLP